MSTKDKQHPDEKPKKTGKPGSGPEKRRRRRSTSQKKPGNEVIYTQPVNFSRKRFLLQLGTMVIVVLALLFAMSLFFKVEDVSVAGVSKYTEWDIFEASGIQKGDNLLTLSKARISSRIYERLPYVKSVRIGRKLPDTVLIEIEELDVTYAVETDAGQWWLMRSDGVMLEGIKAEATGSHTRVMGIKIADPVTGEKAVAVQPEPSETLPDGSTVPITVKAEEQLTAALTIMQNLETNGVLGEITGIDVSDLWDLQMWYGEGDRVRVLLGENTRLAEKITTMTTAFKEQLKPYDKGILDVSMKEGKANEPIFTRIE